MYRKHFAILGMISHAQLIISCLWLCSCTALSSLRGAPARMNTILPIVVTVLLTIANGYFSMAEMALSTAKRILIEHEAQEGDKRAARVLLITQNDADFLAAIQVGITLLGFLSSALAATSLSEPLADLFIHQKMPPHLSHVLATALITIIVSYFSIVIGELVPKRIALSRPEEIAKRVSSSIAAFLTISKPLVLLTSLSAQAVCAALGIHGSENRQDASEDEIRYLVKDSGELSEEEKSMIHDIFDLADTVAREVMIPRVDLTVLEDSATLGEVLDVMQKTGYSRIPIYHENVDRIVGIAHIKDLIGPCVDERCMGNPVDSYMRKAEFVPDTKDIIPLLSEMRQNHEQMVIVVDEYGGTAGIITIEDIVEEIVGEIEDEFDPDNKYLTKINDHEWIVDGRFSVDDARELGWPLQDGEGFETVAGFILDIADGLPEQGSVFHVEGYTFRVQSVRRKRICRLHVIAPQEPAPAPELPTDADTSK